jgi:hypothetical protein
MLLAYFDDSGERGIQLFAAVVVGEEDWMPLLDAWTDYRRWLRREFGLRISRGRGNRVPVELHATEFATGAGAWYRLPVGMEARLRALRLGLRIIGRFARVFAVAWIPDRPMRGTYPDFHESPAVDCWRTCLERLATHSRHDREGQRIVTFVDSGYGPQFTKVLRKMRRTAALGK